MPLTPASVVLSTSLAMLAFAGNSLLCRMALKLTTLDAASFTAVRLLSGAAMLAVLLVGRARRTPSPLTAPLTTHATADPPTHPARATVPGSWTSALALFAYAALFSWAYVGMTTATGALALFAAVQATMIGWGLAHGERLRPRQMAGFAVALGGLAVLLMPGLVTPDWGHALAMLGAGVAWGVYSLRGKARGVAPAADPTATTAGNFIRSVPLALALWVVAWPATRWDSTGLALAVAGGALTSGLGYAVWYRALPALQATQAATVQLSVPVLAALGGVAWLGEALTWPLVAASVAILGGIGLVLVKPRP